MVMSGVVANILANGINVYNPLALSIFLGLNSGTWVCLSSIVFDTGYM